jgi:Protein of unknown function (DUF4085)
MKYFPRDLLERYGSLDDAVANAAHAEWEAALERYEQYLQSIEAELPEHVREFNRLLLHDAVVSSIARQGDRLIMVLRKNIPPRDVVTLTYTLTAEPVIDKDALPADARGPVMDLQHDEFELVREGGRNTYAQTILFGNGWEMTLRFSDVQVTLADPVYPLPDTLLVPVPAAQVAKSA